MNSNDKLNWSPLTKDGSSRKIASYDVNMLCSDWKSRYGIDISSELSGIDNILLYRCDKSGLEFFLPGSAAGSPALYEALEKSGNFYEDKKWEYRTAARDLAKVPTILDVGAGEGHFIKYIRRKRNDLSISGIESNPSAVKIANNKGLDIQLKGLQEILDEGKSYDAITLFQVLEHIPEPIPFLKQVIKAVRPGGLLVITVPSNEGYLKNSYSLLNMPPHHMTRWESRTFKYIENLLPVSILKTKYEPLDARHIPGFVSSFLAQTRERYRTFRRTRGSKLLPYLIAMILRVSGAHRIFRGHTLYVLMRVEAE